MKSDCKWYEHKLIELKRGIEAKGREVCGAKPSYKMKRPLDLMNI